MEEDWSIQRFSGFTLSLYEYEATIPTLWNAVKGAKNVASRCKIADLVF